uniref:Peroxiredoxin n=1 Tax=Eiseniibacteriota bacterium TaxID=2212470 RepID=A0A832MNT8_UNCEI
MTMNATLQLKTVEGRGLLFACRVGDVAFHLDSGPGSIAPSPVQAVLAAIGGCTGMDVISILRKKRQTVTDYALELAAERAEQHPRVLTRVVVTHRLTGRGLSAAAVEEAIRLSDTKYCSVQGMLRPTVEIVSRWEIVEAPAEPAPAA